MDDPLEELRDLCAATLIRWSTNCFLSHPHRASEALWLVHWTKNCPKLKRLTEEKPAEEMFLKPLAIKKGCAGSAPFLQENGARLPHHSLSYYLTPHSHCKKTHPHAFFSQGLIFFHNERSLFCSFYSLPPWSPTIGCDWEVPHRAFLAVLHQG